MTQQQIDTYINQNERLTELNKMRETETNEFKKIELVKMQTEEFRKYTNQTQTDDIHNNYKKFLHKIAKLKCKRILICCHSGTIYGMVNIIGRIAYGANIQIFPNEYLIWSKKSYEMYYGGNCVIAAMLYKDHEYNLVIAPNNLHLKNMHDEMIASNPIKQVYKNNHNSKTDGRNISNLDVKLKEFDKFIKYNFKNCWNIPGLAISVFNDENILFQQALGYANMKTKRKLKITDKFCIASCAKSMLCLAITIAIKKQVLPNIWNMTLSEVYNDIHDGYKNVPIKYLASYCSGITDFNNCPKLKKNYYQNMKIWKEFKVVKKSQKNYWIVNQIMNQDQNLCTVILVMVY